MSGRTTFSAFASVALAGKVEPCSGGCVHGVEVADLALGKPCLFPLSTSATVAQALKALKYNKDIDALSLWVENGSEEGVFNQPAHTSKGGRARDRYRCGGIVTTSDIITFLAREGSLINPKSALSTPLNVIFPSLSQAVEHVHPRTSVCQAMEIMLDGVQNLVVPITRRQRQKKSLKVPGPLMTTGVPSGDFCWITQEDVVRHLLGCIGVFNPLPLMSLEKLGIINTAVMMVDADSPAIMAAPKLQRASQEMTAVAVVTGTTSKLVDDISTQTLRGCSETAAGALATLSVKEFLLYVQDGAGPAQHLVEKVIKKLTQKTRCRKNSVSKLSCPSMSFISSEISTDIEQKNSLDGDLGGSSSPKGPLDLPAIIVVNVKLGISKQGLSSTGRTLITCRPHSSLVAVMAQALAHRVNHVWVTDAEGGLVGIVTYADIIDILLSHLH